MQVYGLKLKEGKWYVGKTKRSAEERLLEHQAGQGSEWTRCYPPLGIDFVHKNADQFDEDKFVKQYMSKYGIENVRGGSYCEFVLPMEKVNVLRNELRSANDRCFTCGKQGHFKSECWNRNRRPCARCSRWNHHTRDCFASRHCDGCVLPDDWCSRCGRSGHWKVTCTHSEDANGYPLRSHAVGQWGNAAKRRFWSGWTRERKSQ